MKLTHHGHSCIELSVADATVLFDPGTFSSFDDVAGLDAIVVTHQHPDHLDPDRLDALREANPDAAWFADPQTAEQLRDKGLDVTATKAGETFSVKGARFEGVGATHAEIHPYIERISNVGIVASGDGEPRLFHPGDSLEGCPENVDYLCLPLVAPWSAVRETIAFVRAVEPKHVIPIHDKVAADRARGIYLGHVRDYGLDGGVDVIEVPEGESAALS